MWFFIRPTVNSWYAFCGKGSIFMRIKWLIYIHLDRGFSTAINEGFHGVPDCNKRRIPTGPFDD